jgi:hypothetical protein
MDRHTEKQMKTRLAAAAALLLSLDAGAALAQSTTTSGPDLRRSSQGRTGTQSLSSHQDMTGSARRAQPQRSFSGTGRPVAGPPASTPNGRPASR